MKRLGHPICQRDNYPLSMQQSRAAYETLGEVAKPRHTTTIRAEAPVLSHQLRRCGGGEESSKGVMCSYHDEFPK